MIDAAAVAALRSGEDPDTLFVAADAPDRDKSRALLRSLESSADGLVDTYFNRFLSRIMTRLLAGTGVTPNAVTIASCLLGLAGVAGIASRDLTLGLIGALVLGCDRRDRNRLLLAGGVDLRLDGFLEPLGHVRADAGTVPGLSLIHI